IGGLLLERFSWHAAFLVNVPLMIAAMIAGLLLLPEARDPAPGRWDVLGTVQAVAGMVAFVWAVKHFAEAGVADPLGWTVLVAAAAVLTWFVRRCLRRPDPLLDVRLFTGRAFTAGVLAALTAMLTMAAL